MPIWGPFRRAQQVSAEPVWDYALRARASL